MIQLRRAFWAVIFYLDLYRERRSEYWDHKWASLNEAT
jgi:hypothetical protein